MKQEKSCGALVLYRGNREKVVVIKHRLGNHWAFPKGHVEQGETEKQTAKREVKEETGLTIDILPGFRHSVHYSPKKGIRKEVVYFIGVTVDDTVTMQEEEIADYKWFHLDEVEQKLTHNNDKHLARRAIKFLRGLKIDKDESL